MYVLKSTHAKICMRGKHFLTVFCKLSCNPPPSINLGLDDHSLSRLGDKKTASRFEPGDKPETLVLDRRDGHWTA